MNQVTNHTIGHIVDMPGTSAPYPFNPSSTTYPAPAAPSEALAERAECPPEVIRAQLGLVTPSELAGALGVKEGTLTVWRSSGEGPPFVKLGKHVYYRMDDLEQWVWSKHPQVKQASAAVGGDDAVQEELPFVPHDEAPKKESPWKAPTEGNYTAPVTGL